MHLPNSPTPPLLTARQAAQLLEISERTLQYRAARVWERGDRTVQKIGHAWLAPEAWWRALCAAPYPAGRPRPQPERPDENPQQ